MNEELHPDWVDEPDVFDDGFNRIYDPEKGCFRDLHVAFIFGDSSDGQRYVRTVEATGRMFPVEANEKLRRILAIVRKRGPSVCTLIEDGGALPMEAEQEPLDPQVI